MGSAGGRRWRRRRDGAHGRAAVEMFSRCSMLQRPFTLAFAAGRPSFPISERSNNLEYIVSV
jgi:hypothetical protein